MHTGQTVSGILLSRRNTDDGGMSRRLWQTVSGTSPGCLIWEEDSAGTENRMNPETDKGLYWGGAQTLGRSRDNQEVAVTHCKDDICYLEELSGDGHAAS